MSYTFSHDRYVTRAVDNLLPYALQLLLWTSIDIWKASGLCLDYLQVFKLSDEDGLLKIVHYQERPAKEESSLLSIKPIHAKIYVIDDITHSTMLLADEY